ncbi:6830_t:CDS:1, partial [Dentiscutata heterogama]
ALFVKLTIQLVQFSQDNEITQVLFVIGAIFPRQRIMQAYL